MECDFIFCSMKFLKPKINGICGIMCFFPDLLTLHQIWFRAPLNHRHHWLTKINAPYKLMILIWCDHTRTITCIYIYMAFFSAPSIFVFWFFVFLCLCCFINPLCVLCEYRYMFCVYSKNHNGQFTISEWSRFENKGIFTLYIFPCRDANDENKIIKR